MRTQMEPPYHAQVWEFPTQGSVVLLKMKVVQNMVFTQTVV